MTGAHDHTASCVRCETRVGQCCPHCRAVISRAEVNRARREARAFDDGVTEFEH